MSWNRKLLNLVTAKSQPAALILLYHRVTSLDSDPWQLCVSPQHFQEQMHWVRDNCCTVSLAELPRVLHGPPAPGPLVAVTFDDGYDDNFHNALPLLEQLAIPATFFLTTPWLLPPHEFWWDELDRIFLQPGDLPRVLRLASALDWPTWQLAETAQFTAQQADTTRCWRAGELAPTTRHAIYSELWTRMYAMTPPRRQLVLQELFEWAGVDRSERPTHRRMTRDEVLLMSRSPLIEIGAHTVSHPALPRLSWQESKREMETSKHALSSLIQRPITSFAYPHGDSSRATRRLVAKSGFARACTTRCGLVQFNAAPFELPRFCVGDWAGSEFTTRIASWT